MIDVYLEIYDLDIVLLHGIMLITLDTITFQCRLNDFVFQMVILMPLVCIQYLGLVIMVQFYRSIVVSFYF